MERGSKVKRGGRAAAVAPVQLDFAVRSSCYHTGVLSARCRRVRIYLIFAAALVWGGLLVTRLCSLQIAHHQQWQNWALRQHVSQIKVASERGPIYDRHQRLLAVSVPAGSVYARPGKVADKDRVSREVAAVLKLEAGQVRQRLDADSPFVWLARQIPRVFAEKVADLELLGVGYLVEPRRFYPYNRAGSALIGKAGVDGTGLFGIEAAFERHLQGEQLQTPVVRDALGNVISVSASAGRFELPKGNALQLTIDAALQIIMDEELDAGRRAANALAAMAVMIDAGSGEILALSQSPGINFNNAAIQSKADYQNRVLEAVFEPGSIMKPLVAAAALEAGLFTPDEAIDCEHGSFRFGRRTINDVHPYGELSLRDVVVRSSNIGMTKVGMRLGRHALYRALRGYGFGEAVGLELPGETSGILRPVERWAQIDVATHAFGQGIAVTPLQMVRAVGAILNGGVLPQLRIIHQEGAAPGERILTEQTAGIVREMMYAVVEDQRGTGKRARIKGVRVGGKTGTAQKPIQGGRGYAPGLYMASFVGFADATAVGVVQKPVLIVVIDEPHADSIYGGVLAAPVFQRIMQRTLLHLSTSEQLTPKTQPEPAVASGSLVRAAYRGY